MNFDNYDHLKILNFQYKLRDAIAEGNDELLEFFIEHSDQILN